jgi:hypothetical protein
MSGAKTYWLDNAQRDGVNAAEAVTEAAPFSL